MATNDDPTEPGTAHLADDIDTDAAARGTVYGLAARAFTEPDAELYEALADDDLDTVRARYNDLFVVGYSEVIDRTDGTIESQGPPVSLYESDYRPEVSWNDVNLDLARAYEYFGCQVDQDDRDNHDNLRIQLEFVGYLCRREAAVDPDVARARLDFHDRHLRVVVDGVASALAEEPGTGYYGTLADFLDRFSAADVEDLAERTGGDGP